MKLDLGNLIIEPLRKSDIEEFVSYRREPDVARFQGWTSSYSRADALELLDDQAREEFPASGKWMQFAVRSQSAELLGDVAVHTLADQPDTYEVGITIKPAAQGRGAGVAALRATVDHLMTFRRAHRVVATCDVRNEAVRRLLSRTAFRWEGTAKRADWFKGEWTSVETWALLQADWDRGASSSQADL